MLNENENIPAIWQTCVEMADSVSQRRDSMNNLFATLNLAVIAAISWMWDMRTAFLCAAGLVVCIVWLLYINSFKKLNTAKFEVILNIEQKMGLSPYKDEWEMLKKQKRYISGTTLERILPIAFAVGYLSVFFVLILT